MRAGAVVINLMQHLENHSSILSHDGQWCFMKINSVTRTIEFRSIVVHEKNNILKAMYLIYISFEKQYFRSLRTISLTTAKVTVSETLLYFKLENLFCQFLDSV